MNIIIGTRGVWRNGSLSGRRCADGLEHMCSQGRLFATPITGTSNNFRPRQRCLRGPTHGKWEESLLQHSSRRFNSLRKVKSSIAVIVSPTDERPGTGTPHFMRFMFRNARMQLIGAKFHCTFQAISKTCEFGLCS